MNLIKESILCKFVIISSIAVLGACATELPPTQKIMAAEAAIAHAEQQQITEYKSVELVEAREKIAAAHVAANEKNMLIASRLAEQAELDAKLSAARANAEKAQIVNDEMIKSTNTMKEEMQRNMGAK